MEKFEKITRGGYLTPSLQIVSCEIENCVLQGSIESTTEKLGNEYTFGWGNEEDLY